MSGPLKARPLVMGILNLAPDSFSDGRPGEDFESALARAFALVRDGADWIDVGGESTRPGAEPVSEAEESDRVIPLIQALAAMNWAPVSIDTMKSGVARAAIAAGARMWNDVTALSYASESLETAAELGCEVVLMHMRGDPKTMQQNPLYDDVVAEVTGFLAERAAAAESAGVESRRIWLDPGIGFGKTTRHNLALLAGLDRLTALGFPVLLGASRKGFIRAVDTRAESTADRLGGSLAAALAGARAGVAMIRVHDVRETVQALEIDAAIEAAGTHA